MSCDCCDCSLVNGYYKCSNNDYRVVDENEDLIDNNIKESQPPQRDVRDPNPTISASKGFVDVVSKSKEINFDCLRVLIRLLKSSSLFIS